MKKKGFILTLFIAVFLFPAEAQNFMKVAAEPVITPNNKRCFMVRQGYSRQDTTKWEPYCGKLINFFYEQGYEYTVQIDKYDIEAPYIRVINTIGRDNSESYRTRVALDAAKRKKEQAKEREELKAKVQGEIRMQVFLLMRKNAAVLQARPDFSRPVEKVRRDDGDYDYDYDFIYDYD
jgi:hypothetical protein